MSVLTFVWLLAGYHIILALGVFEHITTQQAYQAQGLLLTTIAPALALALGALFLPLLFIDVLIGLRVCKVQPETTSDTPDPVALAFGRPQR